ncbi:hypothetical protein GGS20DRAFT_556422 [Poronia punctata]|nr:hypothetical protein GGS20DRAFT_556422 [Poronia punctata]
MIPSRGIARNPASALRYSLNSRTITSRIAPTRQFSYAQSQPPKHGLSRPNTSSLYSQSKPVIGYGSSVGIASGVFAQRSGAARNLSLWPFGSSKTESPKPVETVPAAVETPAEAQTPVVQASASPSPAESAANASVAPTNQPDLTQLPEDLLREFEPNSFLDIPERIGYLKELGLDFGWGPTACCEWLIEHIHVMSGMPWWGSIATVAFLFRALMFLPTLNGSKHQAMLQKVQASPAYIKAKDQFNEAAFRTKDQAAMMYARSEMKRIMQSSGASFWRPMIGMAMFPFSYGMFRLIRGMANVPVPGMEAGGLAWFSDLTVHDPLYILPCISVGLGVLMFKSMRRANASAQSNPMQATIMSGMMYVMPPLMFLGTAWLPAGLQWFFLVLSLGSLAQTQATIMPAVRRWAGLPPLADSNPTVIPAKPQYEAPTSARGKVQSFMSAASKSVKDATGATDEKAKWKKAQEYEERRAQEEKEKMYRRMEEARRRRSRD